MENKTIVIGITGGIASGKSTFTGAVHDFFYKKGINNCPIIDADMVAGLMFLEDDIQEKLIKTFPNSIDETINKIDRKKLGTIVFNDKENLIKLNDIMIPKILENINQKIKVHKERQSPFVFVDAPLLIECAMQDMMDFIVLIKCDTNIRIDRIVKRNSWTKEKAIAAINSQLTDKEKEQYADIVIDTTNLKIEDLKEKTNKIIEKFLVVDK